MNNFFNKQNIRIKSLKSLNDWNNIVENVLYIKTIILACNGKYIKKSDPNVFKTNVTRSSSSIIEDLTSPNRTPSRSPTSKSPSKRFDEENKFLLRKYFNPGVVVDVDNLPDLSYSQTCFNVEKGVVVKRNIRELSYSNLFDLSKSDLNLKFLDETWNIKFWTDMYPRLEIGKIDLRTINNLIGIYLECIRSRNSGVKEDGELIASRWNDIDTICDVIEKSLNISVLNGGNISDELYSSLTELYSGNIDFYRSSDKIINVPLLKHFNTDVELLVWCFNNFKHPRYHKAIIYQIKNFIGDSAGSELKILVPTRFSEGDNLNDIIISVTRFIIEFSSKNDMRIRIKKLSELLVAVETINRNHQKTDPEAPDSDLEFALLPKYQNTLLGTMSMCILRELFYSERIRMKEDVEPNVVEAYEKMINNSVEYLRANGINGLDNKQGQEMFKFFGLVPGKRSPFVKHAYLNKKYNNINCKDPEYKAAYEKMSRIRNLLKL